MEILKADSVDQQEYRWSVAQVRVAEGSTCDKYYQSGFEKEKLGEVTMTKVDGLETSKETQVVVEASSCQVDEIIVDCGNQREDKSSTVAFRIVRGDENTREDFGGSMHSIRDTTKEKFQFHIPTTLTCRHCQEKGHYSLFCPNKVRVPPKTIRICLYCNDGRYNIIDYSVRLRHNEELERRIEKMHNRYKEEDDGEVTEEESSDEDVVGKDTSVGTEVSHKLTEDTSHTLADGANMEDLEVSKGGACGKVKGMT